MRKDKGNKERKERRKETREDLSKAKQEEYKGGWTHKKGNKDRRKDTGNMK